MSSIQDYYYDYTDYDYNDWSKLVDKEDNRLPRYRMFGDFGDDDEANPLGILAAIIVLVVAILAKYLALKIPIFPYQIFLLLNCVFLATIFQYSELLDKYEALLKVNAIQYESLVLPLLITRITLMIDFHCVKPSLFQIVLIAVPRFLLELTILGFLMTNVVGLHVDHIHALMFGIIISPVYPSTIISLVKDLSTLKHLGAIIEMETIITIAISKTLYTLLLNINEEIMIVWYQYIIFLFREWVGGIICGVIFGRIAASTLNLFQNEPSCVIIFHLSTVYVVYLVSYEFGISSYVSVIVVGLYLANERAKLTRDVEKSIMYFWDCAYHIVYTIAYVAMHVLAIAIFLKTSSDKYISSIIILYISCNTLRLLSFFMIYPLLKRSGYGLNIPGLFVLSFANTKDIPNLLFAINPNYYTQMPSVSIVFINHTLMLEALCLLINCTFMGTLMHLLGLSEISQQRRTNMNNCLKFIWKKRALYLPLLKYNRFYAAANWEAINQATIIKHPYMLKLSLDDEDEETLNIEANCPDCSRTFYMEKNIGGRQNVLKETYTRIMKAKRVLYIRLHENGLLSKESKWFLMYLLESTKESNFIELKNTDFEKFIHIPHLLKLSKILKHWRIDPEEKIVIPKQPRREICYYILMHICFGPFMLILLTTQTTLVIINETYQFVGFKFVVYYAIRITMLGFYWLEFIIKVLAFSHKNYRDGLKTSLSTYWRKIVFLLLLILTVKIGITYVSYYRLEEQLVYFGVTIVTIKSIFDYVDWLYIIRYLNFFRYLLRYFGRVVESKIDKKYSDGYDLGKAIVTGDTELLDMLPNLVDDDRILQEIAKNLQTRREKVNNILAEIAKQRPSIAVSVKTKQVIHSILNVMKQNIQELRQAGYIDSIEYSKLTISVEKLVNRLQGMQILSPTLANILFREIPWMGHNNDIISFLYRNVVIRTYDTGAIIIEKGRIVDGIYVVVGGLLKLKFAPYTEDEILALDMGAILIIDYLSTLYFGNDIDDYIVSGNSIGELSFLTGRQYSCTITANTPVQIYHISRSILKAATLEFNDPINGLVPRLWKASCFQLATTLMLSSPLFQYHTSEQVQDYVERAFVPDLSDIQILVLNDLIQDVLLLDGMLADCVTKEVFLPPDYIPRTSQKLLINKDYSNLGSKIETRLMLVPVRDIDPTEIMHRLNQLAEVASKELLNSIRYSMKRKTFTMQHMKKYSGASKEMLQNIKRLVSGSRIIGANLLDGRHSSSAATLSMGAMMMNQGGRGNKKRR